MIYTMITLTAFSLVLIDLNYKSKYTIFSIVPIIVVYLFLNRYFIAGLVAGSLKT